MFKPIRLLALFAIATMISCSDDSSDKETESTVPAVQGEEVAKSELESGSKTFSEVGQSITFSFNGEKGKTYLIDIDYDSKYYFGFLTNITTPGGKIISNRSFVCTETGTHSVTISLTDENNSLQSPFTLSYKVVEFPSLEGKMDGKWLLSKTQSEAFGKSVIERYTPDNAELFLEIKNDSLFNTYYDREVESVASQAEPLASSEISIMNYRVTENSLTFEMGNSIGYASFQFSKYEGSVSNLIWEEQTFDISDLIGNWYLSSSENKDAWMYDGEREDDSGLYTYISAADSRQIYRITKDSITDVDNQFGEDYPSTSPISDYIYILEDLKREGNTLVDEDLYVYIEDDEYDIEYDKKVYAQLEGSFPPEEWAQVSITGSITPLTLNTGHETRVTKNSDTSWYEISLVQGKSYSFEHTSTENRNYYMSAYVVDPATMILESFWSFTPPVTGNYYVVVRKYLYSDQDISSQPVTISVNENSFNSRSASSHKDEPAQRVRKEKRKRFFK